MTVAARLAYGALIALMVLAYLGSVFLLQGLIRTLTGQDSELAIVIITVVVAALLNPVVHRIYAVLDRRGRHLAPTSIVGHWRRLPTLPRRPRQ